MSKISDQTWIPLGLAVTVIGGSAAWLTSIHIQQGALAEAIASKEPVLERMADDIQLIKLKLVEIESRLKKK